MSGVRRNSLSPDLYGEDTPTANGVARPSVMAVEPERQNDPVLYLPNGQPLCHPPRTIGYVKK